MTTFQRITYLGDYIDGEFIKPQEPNGRIQSVNPGDTSDVVGEFEYEYDHVYAAVEAARLAFPKWASLTLKDRAKYF